MLAYILTLLGLPLMCVLWIVFQGWLAKNDPDYNGYKAGCGGCSRSSGDANDSCGHSDHSCGHSETKTHKTHYIDASSLRVKHNE